MKVYFLQLTASVHHGGLAPQLSVQAGLDELHVPPISVVREHVGQRVVSVARIVGAWTWNVPLLACVIWESVPAGGPLGCSGVTKIRNRLETVGFKIGEGLLLTGLSIGCTCPAY